jgi:peptidoglycan/xylan/chitin deacetylase (PgdA/CDA1 family)
MAELSCININFDSIGWNLSLEPKDFRDPSFFKVADRFFEISQKYNFKYTIFIIGKDLENSEVASRVKDWKDQGHEIGNHSYNHKQNLGYLKFEEIEYEVLKSHELITKACGEEPKGFIAPAWATSKDLVKILYENNYLYDTSLFPSYFMWIASAKVYWNFRKDYRGSTALERKDRLANLFGPRHPFFTDGSSLLKNKKRGLLIIPLPVTPFVRFPLWHTMSFLLPKPIFEFTLKSTLKLPYFYYLTHPGDLADLSDIPEDKISDIGVMERIETSLPEKKLKFDRYISFVKEKSANMVTLKSIAEDIISKANLETK